MVLIAAVLVLLSTPYLTESLPTQKIFTPDAQDFIPLIEDALPLYSQIGSEAIPAIPYTRFQKGFPEGPNGTVPEWNNTVNAIALEFLGLHSTPISLESNPPTPAAFLLNQHVPLEDYSQFTDICLRTAWRNDSAIFQAAVDARKSFTDVAYAEDTFVSQLAAIPAIQFPWILTKVSAAHFETITEVFGSDITADVNRTDAEYYMIDTSSMNRVPVSAGDQTIPNNGTLYSLGAITLLRMSASPSEMCTESCSRKLIPIAVYITSQSAVNNSTLVSQTIHKRTSTDSAWILALLAARSSMTGWGVAVGHVLGLHEVTAIFQRSFFNHIAPDHSLRVTMQPYLKYTMQFGSFLFDDETNLDATFAFGTQEGLASLIPIFADHYEAEPWRDFLPSFYYAKHGLDVDDFTIAEEWDILPQLQDNLEMENVSRKFANAVMKTSGYNVDEDVTNDVQLQQMLTDLAAESGGRLGALVHQGNSTEGVTTIADLENVLTTYLYLNFWHAQNSLVSRTAPALFLPALVPPFASVQFLHDDLTVMNYTQTDVLQHMPSAATTVTFAIFVEVFISINVYPSFLGQNDTEVSLNHVYGEEPLLLLSDEQNVSLQEGLGSLFDGISNLMAQTISRSPLTFVDEDTNEMRTFALSTTN